MLVSRRLFHLLWWLLLTISSFPSLAAANQNASPSILLISLDTLRADFVGSYGMPDPVSPFLDRLAKEWVCFSDCIVQAPWTLASHMSLMTSQYPNVHNVNIAEASLDQEKTTLAEILSNAGWYTQGFYSNPFLGGQFGFRKGFIDYGNVGMRHGYQATQGFTSWVQSYQETKPFFVFLHYNDPHNPYIAPDSYYNLFNRSYSGHITGKTEDIVKYVRIPMDPADLHHVRSLYASEVRYLDTQLNLVFNRLKELNLFDNLLIVITADHGEEFKEHGQLEHNQTLYDELLRVPLLIKFPKSMSIDPQLFVRQVKNLDILPTILETVGLPIPQDSVQGHSLLPLITGADPMTSALDVIFSESANTHKVSVRSPAWKYIYDRRTKTEELYNLNTDPAEQTNVKDENPELVTQLAAMVQDYLVRAQGGWHIRTRNPFPVVFTVKTSGQFTALKPYSLETNDRITLSNDGKTLDVILAANKSHDRLDGIDFRLEPPDATLTFDLDRTFHQDREAILKKLFIGVMHQNPPNLPVELNGPAKRVDPEVPFNKLMIVNRGKDAQQPGFYLWHSEDPEQHLVTADIDDETRANLESLGYFR